MIQDWWWIDWKVKSKIQCINVCRRIYIITSSSCSARDLVCQAKKRKKDVVDTITSTSCSYHCRLSSKKKKETKKQRCGWYNNIYKLLLVPLSSVKQKKRKERKKERKKDVVDTLLLLWYDECIIITFFFISNRDHKVEGVTSLLWVGYCDMTSAASSSSSSISNWDHKVERESLTYFSCSQSFSSISHSRWVLIYYVPQVLNVFTIAPHFINPYKFVALVP